MNPDDLAVAELSIQDKAKFARYLGDENGYRVWLNQKVRAPIFGAMQRHVPQHLLELCRNAELAETALSSQGMPYAVPGHMVALLHRAALHYRHAIALRQSQLLAKISSPEYSKEIDMQSSEVSEMLKLPWLRRVTPLRRPRLTDYVNLRTARDILRDASSPMSVPRVYDEKFGILWSPSLWSQVMEAARTQSWLIGTTVCVAYLDIDDFKKQNTQRTETTVDREVLPPFMMRLEAHTASRGCAFRIGGDEYLLVCPNLRREEAESWLEYVRSDIERSSFGGASLTLSIGYDVIDDGCAFTNEEVLERSNRAKNVAKLEGKNRVVRAGDDAD